MTKNDELLKRYLHAVRCLLPQKQRNDVSRELEENLRSEIEEKKRSGGGRSTRRSSAHSSKGWGTLPFWPCATSRAAA